jgi:tellurite resistance protein
MTPAEMNIVKSLVVVAWADGRLEDSETGVVEGLLVGFDATPEEEGAILEYAKTRRTLDEIPVEELGVPDRELLLGNATLLTLVDGEQSVAEKALLWELSERLGLSREEASRVFAEVESNRGA